LEIEFYRIYQKNIFDLLRTGGVLADGTEISGQDFFRTCIPIEFNRVASQFGTKVILNPDRLDRAHEIWNQDIERVKVKGGGKPDQFKHAGLLAYWLRRLQVIDQTTKVVAYDTEKGIVNQNCFLTAPSELCSLLFGFNLSVFYSHYPLKEKYGSLEKFLYIHRPSDFFIEDAAEFMRTKYVSPHSLYLIYRVIFERPKSAIFSI
jgi:hypothetical protein